MKQLANLLLLLLVCASSHASDAPRLPAEWRMPSLEEMQLAAKGDLNGDGRPETVYIVKSKKPFDEALLVWLSESDGTYRWVTLTRYELKINLGYPSRVFISGPGKHTVMCIQTKDKCIPPRLEGLDNVTTDLPVVYYSALANGTGASVSLFYWDKRSKQFIHGRQGE